MLNNNQIKTCVADEKHPVFVVGSGSLIMTKKAIVNGWYSLNNQVIHSTDYVDKNGTINHVHSTQVIESITNEIPLIFDDIFIEFSSKNGWQINDSRL